MSKERLKITQPLCVTAKFMLERGGTITETAQLLGISQSTLSRIQAADFDAEKYAAQLETRRAEDQKKREELKQAEEQLPAHIKAMKKEKPAEDQVPGQLQMDLPVVKQWNPASGKFEPYTVKDMNTMMRFQAAMTEKILTKLTTINDYLCQLIRCMRKE